MTLFFLAQSFYFSTSALLLAYISISSWEPHTEVKRTTDGGVGGMNWSGRVFKVAYQCACMCFLLLYTMRSRSCLSYYDKSNMFCVSNTQCFLLNCKDFCKCTHTCTQKRNEIQTNNDDGDEKMAVEKLWIKSIAIELCGAQIWKC